MSFNTNLPPENTDPWYSGMVSAWDALKTFVNGLQASIATKASTTDLSTGLATKVNTSTYTAGLAGKADLVGGVVPTSQMPAIAISSFLGTVASQAAMLALTGQEGDWAIRSDTSATWIITGATPSNLSSWTQIVTPGGGGAVASVNGQAGVVVLGAADVGAVPTTRTVAGKALSANVTLVKGDVGLGSVDNTADADKPVSTATVAALAGKAPIASPAFTGNPTAPTPAAGDADGSIATTAYVQTELGSLELEDLADVGAIPAGSLLGVAAGGDVVGVTVTDVVATDIPYGASNVGATLDSLLSRVIALENAAPILVVNTPPAISGTLTVGSTLTASNGTWRVGGVASTPDSFTYQWKRSGANISGATGQTYSLVSDDLGTNTITVTVTAVKAGHTSGVATSAAVTIGAGVVPLSLQNVGSGTGVTSNDSDTHATVPKPTGVANGDFLLALLRSNSSAGGSDWIGGTGAGAWTKLGPAWPGAGATSRIVGIYGKRITDSTGEPASYVFDRTSAAGRNTGVILNLRGVPNTGYYDTGSTDYYGTDITSGKRVAALTASTNGSKQIVIATSDFVAGNDHVAATPSGFTLAASAVTSGAVASASRTTVMAFIRDVNAGAVAAVDIVWPGAVVNPVAHSIIIKPGV